MAHEIKKYPCGCRSYKNGDYLMLKLCLEHAKDVFAGLDIKLGEPLERTGPETVNEETDRVWREICQETGGLVL